VESTDKQYFYYGFECGLNGQHFPKTDNDLAWRGFGWGDLERNGRWVVTASEARRIRRQQFISNLRWRVRKAFQKLFSNSGGVSKVPNCYN
jgi:hypothetical protein